MKKVIKVMKNTILLILLKTSFCDDRELYIFKFLFDEDIVKILALLTNII